jgi:hypothetical protein
MTASDDKHEALATYAHNEVRRVILQAMKEVGVQLIDRRISDRHPDWGTLRDAPAQEGLVAARAIENAARGRVVEYLKHCREQGVSWSAIGKLLNLEDEAKAADRPVADLAFDVAAGPVREDAFGWTRGERCFWWRCPSCHTTVNDQGPDAYPETGGTGQHSPGCKRLAVDRRAYAAYCRERGW